MPGSLTKRQKRAEYKQKLQSSGEIQYPKKGLFRQRAHANPFSDHYLDYPTSPEHMDWSTHFPAFVDSDPNNTNLSGARRLTKDVEVADIGCGFGGLIVALAPLMPETLMVGMEIRVQVLDFVTQRINALRAQKPPPPVPNSASPQPKSPSASSITPSAALPLPPASAAATASPSASPAPTTTTTTPAPESTSNQPGPSYQNISCLRSNTMKFLPNFFTHSQLSKIFICFPDPHFKARKHKARIVSAALNAEYAYVLRPGGKLYTITDVEELHEWIVGHFDGEEEGEEDGDGAVRVKELWERVGEEELEGDECVRVMKEETEEGKKVARVGGKKFVAVWRRKEDPEWP
ncbi:tRNA (guanine-N(7)-)-methyltransferase [Polytolypa hystricis UAMH7299]|uniref:tRNA (guanine-N(7)-)-methyltransferase n=1 Tax=Polytolypa hystricis (strain UAMH7299) TaxID=1447883 RepID=A0A2B7XUB1_POLH7|nr:tRNA (guanine-N(7)-)-methyltransferase [Polytolypa hystricis UAMH7299]